MNDKHKVSRRDVLRAGVATGAAMAAMRAGAQEAPKEVVRLGFVGMGGRGTWLLRMVLQFPNVHATAVCDIVPERATKAQALAEEATGVKPRAYTAGPTDYENLVQQEDLDAVVIATPWDLHAPVSVAAMQAGKYVGTEVPAAMTLEDCWKLVRTSEATGRPCMMLENVCYFQNVLTILRMVREGVFGELLHAEAGYQHDCRSLMVGKDGLPWRGEWAADTNGNLYPTHPIGPVAQWFGINRGDRFTRLVSMSTKSGGVARYAADKFDSDHPLAQREYALGDINTCLIQTANGRTVTLYFDICTPRPYDLIFRLQGAKGIYSGSLEKIYLEGRSPEEHQWEPFEPYLAEYAHPLWTNLEEEAVKSGGHGGADYITMFEFVKAVRNGTQTPQDVYDAAAWSAIVPLSIQSVAENSATLDFPDFTGGKWKTNPPIEVYGA